MAWVAVVHLRALWGCASAGLSGPACGDQGDWDSHRDLRPKKLAVAEGNRGAPKPKENSCQSAVPSPCICTWYYIPRPLGPREDGGPVPYKSEKGSVWPFWPHRGVGLGPSRGGEAPVRNQPAALRRQATCQPEHRRYQFIGHSMPKSNRPAGCVPDLKTPRSPLQPSCSSMGRRGLRIWNHFDPPLGSKDSNPSFVKSAPWFR